MKANTVEFVPPLPDKKRAAIQRMGLSRLNKIWLVFEKPFWNTDVAILEDISSDSGVTVPGFYSTKIIHPNHYCLFGFYGGDFSLEMEKKTHEERLAFVLNRLEKMFGKEIPKPIFSHSTAWNSDPFSMGSYTAIAVGL